MANFREQQYTTGSFHIPDIGVLSYNGCVFSPLYATTVNGVAIKDNAQRTVKYMEYTITADGYVTHTGQLGNNGAGVPLSSCNPQMENLRILLTAQGGHLVYRGRGMDLIINPPGGGPTMDVAWGPAPELLDFQPLGAGRSAKVKWQVKIRIPDGPRGRKDNPGKGGNNIPGDPGGGGGGGGPFEIPRRDFPDAGPGPGGGGGGAGGAIGFLKRRGRRLDVNAGGGNAPNINNMVVNAAGLANIPLLQLNYETSVSYNEDGYSMLTVRGTMEIPMTRSPNQSTRDVTHTVDDVRAILDARIFGNIDLTRFRITRREFNVSRDKRVMEWNVTAEEKPYMDLPPDITVARGTFSVRPAKAGAGLATWLCTLRATYTVRADKPRRVAWMAFLTLLRLRMNEDERARIVPPPQRVQAPEPNFFRRIVIGWQRIGGNRDALADWQRANVGAVIRRNQQAAVASRSLLIDFSFDEGLYLDSKTITFSATWRLVVPFSQIMVASGLWKKVIENNNIPELNQSPNKWAASMKDIMGHRSWLPNKLNPNIDIIVDFGL